MTSNTRRNLRRAASAHPQRPQGDQSALLVAATRRGPAAHCAQHDEEPVTMVIPSSVPHRTYAIPAPPADFVPYPPPRTTASHLSDRVEREITFDDLPPENPELLDADPRHAVSAGRGQLPKSWLRTVSPLSPLDVDQRIALAQDALLDVEIELASLSCAIGDLATFLDPKTRGQVGKIALKTLRRGIAAVLVDLPASAEAQATMLARWREEHARAAEAMPVSACDRRPLGVAVGHALPDSQPTALDDLPEWIRADVEQPHGLFRAAIHHHAAGAHLTTITPNVAMDRTNNVPVHLCHRCDRDQRTGHAAWVSASTVTILTMSSAVAA